MLQQPFGEKVHNLNGDSCLIAIKFLLKGSNFADKILMLPLVGSGIGIAEFVEILFLVIEMGGSIRDEAVEDFS